MVAVSVLRKLRFVYLQTEDEGEKKVFRLFKYQCWKKPVFWTMNKGDIN